MIATFVLKIIDLYNVSSVNFRAKCKNGWMDVSLFLCFFVSLYVRSCMCDILHHNLASNSRT